MLLLEIVGRLGTEELLPVSCLWHSPMWSGYKLLGVGADDVWLSTAYKGVVTYRQRYFLVGGDTRYTVCSVLPIEYPIFKSLSRSGDRSVFKMTVLLIGGETLKDGDCAM